MALLGRDVPAVLSSSKNEGRLLLKNGDPIDDAMTIDEAASAFTSRCGVENFFRMKESPGDVGVGGGVVVVGVVERNFLREGSMGWD